MKLKIDKIVAIFLALFLFCLSDVIFYFELNKIEYFGYMDKIICISKNTKKDLIEYYKIPEELIEVVHLGVSFDKNYIKIDNMFPKKPYILFVGERSRYKNFKNFINKS